MTTRHGTRAMMGGAALAGVVLVRRERKRLEHAQCERDAAQEREQRLLGERDRLRLALSRRETQLAQRGQMIGRLQQARRAERGWNHELRAQLQRAQLARGGLAEVADVRELVLRAAIELVDADKGLLLSREDVDADGDLDLVCAYGFEDDAEHSAIAQRFAREVLERDRILREDSPPEGGDGEIRNLVAIPLYLLDRFHGVVVCANREDGFEDLDDDVLLALGDHAGSALNMQRLENQLNQSHRSAVEMLADALEARDTVRRLEAGQTAMLARMLCRRIGVEERELEVVATAALLRDVGHLAIPDHVLFKPGPLAPEERSIVELHPRTGFRLIGRMGALEDVASAVLYHHERYDGTGYPVGLAGTAIPFAARVLTIVDAYSAITHERPHRRARSPEEALAVLTAGAGTHFDPEFTQIFLEELRGGAGPDLQRELAERERAELDGLPAPRDVVPASDPLTLLPGHRAFREAIQRAAAAEQQGFCVAIVEIDGLDDVNARDGYVAGDRAILGAARGAQLAAVRVGGRAYRDSGRRLAILVATPPDAPRPDLAAELHIELALGPPVRVGVASWRSGESGDEVVRRARSALAAALVPPARP